MAIYEFGIDAHRIKDDFPMAEPEPFGAPGAHGVTTEHVTTWITESAGQISSVVLSKLGASFDLETGLEVEDHESIKSAIVSRVIYKALLKLRKVELAKEYLAEWTAVYDLWANRPSDTLIGSSLPMSNIELPAKTLHFGKDHQW